MKNLLIIVAMLFTLAAQGQTKVEFTFCQYLEVEEDCNVTVYYDNELIIVETEDFYWTDKILSTELLNDYLFHDEYIVYTNHMPYVFYYHKDQVVRIKTWSTNGQEFVVSFPESHTKTEYPVRHAWIFFTP